MGTFTKSHRKRQRSRKLAATQKVLAWALARNRELQMEVDSLKMDLEKQREKC